MIVEEKEKEENIRRRKIFVCGGEIRKKGGNIRRRKIFFGIGEEKQTVREQEESTWKRKMCFQRRRNTKK